MFGGGLGTGWLALSAPSYGIAPTAATVHALGAGLTFAGRAGVPPYSYGYAPAGNVSGGSIDATTGAYVPGATGPTVDLVRVTDSKGQTADARVTVLSPDWRTLTTYSGWWDQNTIAVSGGGPNVANWNDGSGNGAYWIVGAGTPVKGTVNGINCITVGGADTLAQSAAGTSLLTTGAGWIVVAVKMAVLPSTAANVYQAAGIIADGTNWWGMGADASGTRGYIFDSGYEEPTTETALDTSHVKIIELWWDGTHVFDRVNGGTTNSKGTSALGGLATPGIGKNGAVASTFGQFSILAAAMRKGIPTNAAAIVAAMVTEYGAA